MFLVEDTDPLSLVLPDELCDLTAAPLLELEPDERCDLAVASPLLEEEEGLLSLLTLAFRLLPERVFIVSRFELPALRVVAFLFTSLSRVPELTVPLFSLLRETPELEPRLLLEEALSVVTLLPLVALLPLSLEERVLFTVLLFSLLLLEELLLPGCEACASGL